MSKEKILSAIRKARPEATALPDIPAFPQPTENTLQAFKKRSEALGSKVIMKSDVHDINQAIKRLFPEATLIASPLKGMETSLSLETASSPHELAGLDVAVLRAQLGVAENGALWLSENDCVFRVLPFITQHLVLILDQKMLVNTMHEAYQKIRIDETGFGLFVAGPSKTADIEQSLVIGAQGARSLTIFIVK